MQFGIFLPNSSEGLIYPIPFASAHSIVELGQEAEGLDYDSVWVSDHFTAQKYVKASWSNQHPNYFDPLITLSMVSAVTSRIGLNTGIIALPLRDVVVLAKQVSSLDAFSGGRTKLGVGVGAYREEFKAVRGSMFAEKINRNQLADESIRALRQLFSRSPAAEFDGDIIKFGEIEMYPKPSRNPYPILIGGNGSHARQRVARLGDGWFPAMLSPEEVGSGLESIKQQLKDPKRKLEVQVEVPVCLGDSYEEAVRTLTASGLFKHEASLKESTLRHVDNLQSKGLIGTISDAQKTLEEYLKAGVDGIVIDFPATNLDEFKSRVRSFAKDVVPSYR